MVDLILYNYFRSSASYRVRIALHWKGLPFEYRAVHLLNGGGEQHLPTYRALNPAGEVPTLVHQGKSLAQSMAILQFLEETFPQKPLLPSPPAERALVIQFCEHINCAHPLQNLKVLQYLEKEAGFSEEKKQKWLHDWITRSFVPIESMLGQYGGLYCFGDTITLADAFLIPQVFSANRFKVPLDAFPRVRAINEACVKLEAFKMAHPFAQPDTPPENR